MESNELSTSMSVGIGYITINCDCTLCRYKWVAVDDTPLIKIDRVEEFRLHEQHCPKCGSSEVLVELVKIKTGNNGIS